MDPALSCVIVQCASATAKLQTSLTASHDASLCSTPPEGGDIPLVCADARAVLHSSDGRNDVRRRACLCGGEAKIIDEVLELSVPGRCNAAGVDELI